MEKQVNRKTVDVYNQHFNSEFSIHDDNLNPKHHSSFDDFESKVVNEINIALDEVEQLIRLKKQDEANRIELGGEINNYGVAAPLFTGGRQFPSKTLAGLEGRLVMLAAEAGMDDTNFSIYQFMDCDGVQVYIKSNSDMSFDISTTSMSDYTSNLDASAIDLSSLDLSNLDDGNSNNIQMNFSSLKSQPCRKINVGILALLVAIAKIIKIIIMIINLLRVLLNKITRLVGQAGQCWVNPTILPETASDIVGTIMALLYQLIGLLLQKLFEALNVKCWNDWSLSMLDELMSILSGILNISNSVSSMTFAIKNDKANPFDKIKESVSKAFGNVTDSSKWKSALQQMTDVVKKEADPDTILENVISSSPDLQDTVNSVKTAIDQVSSGIESVSYALNSWKAVAASSRGGEASKASSAEDNLANNRK